MSEWQLMNTAPKDGSLLLFVSEPSLEYTIGKWDGDCWDMQAAPPKCDYTHWMYVPCADMEVSNG